jgi:Na+/H+ antiporter NhaD/arsenite permease-like protein
VDHLSLGDVLPPWTVVPFVGLLLSIALLPLVAPHFWHSVRRQLAVAVAWAAPVFVGLLFYALTDDGHTGHEAAHALEHAFAEYLSFICLLGSLYVVSGGVLLRGDLVARPIVNTAFLGVGAVLANIVGTTGASMLLIRPVLRTNIERRHTWHIPLFFIFLVSNVGGALTPIGDPPLFIGYLRGIPFTWTLGLWPMWVPVVVVLLAMFFVLDTIQHRRETLASIRADVAMLEPLRIDGGVNLLILAAIVASVVVLSPDPDVHDFRSYHAREVAQVLLAGLSLWVTPKLLRKDNDFSWAPILEVAALFVGIFVAMIPATAILQARGAELAIVDPLQYFWATGFLSAFLDNAPTYAAFTAMACGNFPSCTTAEQLGPLVADPVSAEILAAISLGAVYWGAGSYIGNGPNFMVRAIAVRAGYAMPSFFGYCGWAALFLGPPFLVMSLLAFG